MAEAAAVDPEAEQGLVDTARSSDLRATQDEARRAIVRADERSGERALRVHRRRSLKTWLSVDGEGHGVWNIPAEAHHRFLAALEPYRRQAFRDARANGVRLSDEALMADALDMLARDVLLDLGEAAPGQDGPPTSAPQPAPSGPDAGDGSGSADGREGADADGEASTLFGTEDHHDDAPAAGGDPRGPAGHPGPHRPRPAPPRRRHRRAPNQVMVMIDFDALRRGFAEEEETCEITGLGPIPVALARHMMDDALLRLVVTGTDVTVVSSQRRYVPADLRAAIWARDGGTCVVPGCHATRGLEIDHCRIDFARDGPTALWNSALLCRVHHVLKTIGGWTLAGGHEEGWTFTPPEGRPSP
ncbi:hypothetical protein HC251_02230 [Iamia sp. SCSIO 61187]|uniref:HNH endonuclease n=1 Tax=Iamia sp. SCSIO 61187 TaxID=2722752 RepID=UPI001C6378CF|nr:HNH endonuclease signature motif containing protein [Iamia sp. SCSIO 61187]QYG91368.1 hypothetical protein HC251_02230 [Iamia sp. SCSIO 61187]